MVGIVCGGSNLVVSDLGGYGLFLEITVFTAYPSGVMAPSFINLPLASSLATIDSGALGHTGAAAEMRYT